MFVVKFEQILSNLIFLPYIVKLSTKNGHIEAYNNFFLRQGERERNVKEEEKVKKRKEQREKDKEYV